MAASDSYISYFTPSEMSHETLEFILVKRQKLVQRLVDRVRDSVLTSAKYQSILLGPRGMGKSHMVALVYYRIKADKELEGKVAIAMLAEEEWGVATLVDLYFVILEALEKEYGGLRAQIDALYDLPMSPTDQRTGAAAELIRTFVGERTLFLLVENLEEIFRGLDSDELWTFRSFLSKTPFATILATNPSLFNGIDKQQEAFFGFFQPTYLDELSTEEATELLGKLAERREDTALTNFLKTTTAQDRVQAVHDLAGGHPRIYLLFADLLTRANLDELVTPFLEFLDKLTPYYQDRMKSLSPQQRKIVAFLSEQRGAAAVKEIVARSNGLTSQTLSGQLDKLEEMGYVRKTKVGRESHYELREPLLRMVLEKKRGRGELIRLVVDFLRRWYSREERRARLQNALAYASSLTRKYWEASLDLNRAMQDTPNPNRAQELSPEFWEMYNANNFSRATEIAAEIIERKTRLSTSDDWFLHGYCSAEIRDYPKALESYNLAIELNPQDATAWNNRGSVLFNMGRNEEALTNYNKAIELNPQSAVIWSNRGSGLRELKQYKEALKSYDKVVEFDPQNATAWRCRGDVLNHLEQYAEALKCLDKAIELDPRDTKAWHHRGKALVSMEQNEEALKSCNKLIELDPKDAFAWSNRGYVLDNMGHVEEALKSYDKAFQLDPQNAVIWNNHSRILLRMDQWDSYLNSLEVAFLLAKPPKISMGISSSDAEVCCRTILKRGYSDELSKLAALTTIYVKHGSLGALGQGVIESIPSLFAPEITDARAEEWLAAWNAAGAGHDEMVIPLRLLAAAVAWKPKRDIRALLTLAIEERRILEKLLPGNVETTR